MSFVKCASDKCRNIFSFNKNKSSSRGSELVVPKKGNGRKKMRKTV